jgi:hypothetical protein
MHVSSGSLDIFVLSDKMGFQSLIVEIFLFSPTNICGSMDFFSLIDKKGFEF